MKNETKPKVALALGSGSARGLAHVGVLQVLEENDIPIDFVSGCSMGAVIGSIYASGTNLQLLEQLFCQMKSTDLYDYNLPKRGLVRGNRFQDIIRTLTKNKDFDELNIPFNCVACDIRAGITRVLDTGKVHDAVRASMSIPGIFEPVTLDGILYVDGAVMEPVPVDAARKFGADLVIAVDVGMQSLYEDIRETTWDILQRALDLMGQRAKMHEINTADISINPKVTHTSRYTNDDAAETIAIGRQATLDVLPEIKKKLQMR